MSSILGKLGTHAANMRSGFLSVCALGVADYAVWSQWGQTVGLLTLAGAFLLIDFVRDKTIAAEAGKR